VRQVALAGDSPHARLNPNRMVGFSNRILLTVWALLTLSVGTSTLGTPSDYLQYLIWYEEINPYFSYTESRFEPGFYSLGWVFRHIFGTSFNFFIGCLAAVSLGIKFWLFKRYLHYPVIGMFLYVAIFFPIHEYTQYRVALSLAFGYLAIHLMLEKRWGWTVLLFAVSLSLHGSSLIMIALCLVGYILPGNKALLAVLGVTATLGFLFEDLREVFDQILLAINPLTVSYLENEANLSALRISSINNLLLIGVCFFCIVLGYHHRSRYHMIFLSLTLASFVPIIFLSESPIIGQRAKEVLFFAVVFLVCKSRFRMKDTPVIAFAAAQASLLLYLRVREGVLFG
jgi:hypothetical protein